MGIAATHVFEKMRSSHVAVLEIDDIFDNATKPALSDTEMVCAKYILHRLTQVGILRALT